MQNVSVSDSVSSSWSLCLMSGALWEMKNDLRIEFPSSPSGSVVTWIQGHSLSCVRNTEGFSLGSWLISLILFQLVSFLLPGFPLGSNFYKWASLCLPLPSLVSQRSQWGLLSGPASYLGLKIAWAARFLFSVSSWAFEKTMAFSSLIRSALRRLWMSAQVGSWVWKIPLISFRNPSGSS